MDILFVFIAYIGLDFYFVVWYNVLPLIKGGMILKERARDIFKSFAVIFAVGIVYYLICTLTDLALKCPTYEIFGILCPGCGLSRMCISLLRFDFASAFYYNAAFLLLSPILLSVGISYYYRYIKYGTRALTKWQRIAMAICIAALIVFGVLRNFIPLGLLPNEDGGLIDKLKFLGGT